LISFALMPTGQLESKLKALIFYRALFITLLLGSSVFFEDVSARIPYPEALSAFIVALYGLTIVYSLLFNKLKNSTGFAYAQLIGDIVAEAVLVYLSGGIESWFSFTFLLTILSASIILHGKAGYFISSLATILYGTLLVLQSNRIILNSPEIFSASDYLYNIFVHMLAFYSMGFLSSQLADRLRKVTENLEKTGLDLSDLKAFSRDVIEFIPVGLITADTEGNALTANSAAKKILGQPANGIEGKILTDLFPFISLEHGYDERIEGEIKDNGTVRVIGLTISPLKNRTGKAVGKIVIFRDLTKIRAMEIEMQKRKQLAAVGELSAWIAHELRNPLASLKSSIEMLREEKEPSRYSFQLMDIAVKEMDRLNAIITDFLIYARPKPLKKQTFDLAEVLRELSIVFSYRKDIRIINSIRDKLTITGDPDQLKQVFLNLLLNAVEAMPGGGEIYLEAENHRDGLEIRIRDSGMGISVENIDKVFYPYFSTKNEGTGLGLAIAYRIIEKHQGSLQAESPPEGGAVFTVTLPTTLPTIKNA